MIEAIEGLGSSISATLALFEAGGGSEDEFNAAVKEVGIEAVVAAIMEGVAEAGFFGKALQKLDAKSLIKEVLQSQQTSQDIGEATKN